MVEEVIPKGFRKTELGAIPEVWGVHKLGELLLNARLGGNYPNQKKENDHPLIKMGNLTRGSMDFSKIEYISDGFIPDEQHMLFEDDVLFNTRNTLDLVGKVAVWRNELPVAFYNSNILRLEFDPRKICSGIYANAMLNSSRMVACLRGLATGTTSVAAIYTRDLMKAPMIAPPLVEQLAIATVLSDIDALIAGLDQLIAKKRALKQATMQQLLTGQIRLPGFHGEWEVRKLGDAGKCLRGVSYNGDNDLSTYDTPQTKRLLRSNNIQNAVVVTDDVQFVNADRVASHQILQQDDILICMANGSKALVGKAGIFMEKGGPIYTFGAFMGCFRTNSLEANPAFVFYLFLTGRYRDNINNLLAGSSINNLRPSSIESLEFSMPLLQEQTAIATVLSDMDAELTTLEQRRDKTRLLKQGMMQQLLTGRIRLVAPTPSSPDPSPHPESHRQRQATA